MRVVLATARIGGQAGVDRWPDPGWQPAAWFASV